MKQAVVLVLVFALAGCTASGEVGEVREANFKHHDYKVRFVETVRGGECSSRRMTMTPQAKLHRNLPAYRIQVHDWECNDYLTWRNIKLPHADDRVRLDSWKRDEILFRATNAYERGLFEVQE